MTTKLARILFFGLTIVVITSISIRYFSDDYIYREIIFDNSAPALKKIAEISIDDIGPQALVSQVAFSPDGNYLAVKATENPGQSDIIIIDTNKKIRLAKIRCDENYSELDRYELQWNNLTTVSFGGLENWNAITGKKLPDLPVIGLWGKFNKDKSKLLTIVKDKYLNIYDTKNWSNYQVASDELSIKDAIWNSDDNIIFGLGISKETFGKIIANHLVNNQYDFALRLYDVKQKSFSKTKWLSDEVQYGTNIGKINFSSDAVTIGTYSLVDGKHFNSHVFPSMDEVLSNKISAIGGEAFSPDGKYLYFKDIKKHRFFTKVNNLIVETSTLRKVASFSGGDRGIDISPDNRLLALGNSNSIIFLKIN